MWLRGQKQQDNHPGVYREPYGESSRVKEFIVNMSHEKFINGIWNAVLFGIIGVIIALILKAILASGRVEYCYLENWVYIPEKQDGQNPPAPLSTTRVPNNNQTLVLVWELKGHRNWRDDRDIGRFDTFDAALDAAAKINCQLETK